MLSGLPSHWQPPLETNQEFALTPATPEYTTVEQGFMKTLGAGGNAILEVKQIWLLKLLLPVCNFRLFLLIY